MACAIERAAAGLTLPSGRSWMPASKRAVTTSPIAAMATSSATRATALFAPEATPALLLDSGENRGGQGSDGHREADREDEQRGQELGQVVEVGVDAKQ